MTNHIQITKSWIKTFVIGYNLCPFAAKPFNEDRIKYHLYEGDSLEELVEQIFLECSQLAVSDPNIVETTILIHPNALLDFTDYFSVYAQIEEDIEKLGLAGQIQLASFHPHYQFADTNEEDPENFTNRSPFPMFHILRAESVEQAIKVHPDTHRIPEINIATMNRIGREELTKQRNEIIRKN